MAKNPPSPSEKTIGKLITVEGGDGSGKSTLIGSIKTWFEREKIPFLLTREPGGTEVAEEIRTTLLAKRAESMSSIAELFLYEAARAEHVEKTIKPALLKNTHVLCDRFTHSSLAYQGAGRGLGLKFVELLNIAATAGISPDAVIWLKVPPATAHERMKNRGNENRLDREPFLFHEKVFEAFSEISQKESERFIVLDATQSPEKVFQDLLQHPIWKALWA